MSIKYGPPATTPLDITATVHQDEARIALTGEIDLSNADQVIRSAYQYLDEPGIARVTVDLAALTFIDSCGLRALVFGRRRADHLDKMFCIQNQQEHIAKVIMVSGLGQYLTDPTYRP